MRTVFSSYRQFYTSFDCWLRRPLERENLEAACLFKNCINKFELGSSAPRIQCTTELIYSLFIITYAISTKIVNFQADIHDPELHRQARSVLLELGRYFQVQVILHFILHSLVCSFNIYRFLLLNSRMIFWTYSARVTTLARSEAIFKTPSALGSQ